MPGDRHREVDLEAVARRLLSERLSRLQTASNRSSSPVETERDPNLNQDVKSQAETEAKAREMEVDHKEKDYGLKKWLFCWVLGVVTAQLVAAAILVICVGLDKLKLSDGVIIAFLTGTTIEVLGLAFIVARHLFPTGKDGD